MAPWVSSSKLDELTENEASYGLLCLSSTDSHLVECQHLDESNLHHHVFQSEGSIAVYIILATHDFSKVWRGGRGQMNPEYHHASSALRDLFVVVCQNKVFDRGKPEIFVNTSKRLGLNE